MHTLDEKHKTRPPFWQEQGRRLFWAGRRRNHLLLGFYRYHLDSVRNKMSPISKWIAVVAKNPRTSVVLRGLVFWPLMGLAAVLLYTGGGLLNVAPPAWHTENVSTAGVAEQPEGALIPKTQAPPALSSKAISAKLPADEPRVATDGADAGDDSDGESAVETHDAQKAAPQQPATADHQPTAIAQQKADPVAAALAKMPAFVPDDAIMPVTGQIVRSTGWYRHPVFDDWRMSTGVVIVPDRPGGDVRVAYPGVVEEVRKTAKGDWAVQVVHKDDWRSTYSGLESTSVRPHDVVSQGAVIGKSAGAASTEVSFSLRHHQTIVDPVAYLP